MPKQYLTTNTLTLLQLTLQVNITEQVGFNPTCSQLKRGIQMKTQTTPITTKEHKMLELAGYFYHSAHRWTAPMCVLQACKEYKISLRPHMFRLFTSHLTHGATI